MLPSWSDLALQLVVSLNFCKAFFFFFAKLGCEKEAKIGLTIGLYQKLNYEGRFTRGLFRRLDRSVK